MRSIAKTARIAGLLYVAMSVFAILGYMYFPGKFMVSGDATGTAAKIIANMQLYRISVFSALAGQFLFIFVVLALYNLFKDVDQGSARMMVALVLVGVAGEIVNLGLRSAPIILLSGADYLAAFTKPQLAVLSYSFIRIANSLGNLIVGFWGLWLFPFGIAVIKSRFLPKVLGILLFLSGFAYVVTCLVNSVFPDQAGTVLKFVSPLYFGELAVVLWLPIMGAKERVQ